MDTINAQLIPLSCDDTYFSLILRNNEETSDHHENEENPVLDSKYAEELQLQEAIAASLTNIQALTPKLVSVSSRELGSSSSGVFPAESSTTTCEICAETKDRAEIFPADKNICPHSFCNACISKHISIRVQKSDANTTQAHSFSCPGIGCLGKIEVEKCREIIPGEVISMWDKMIDESSIDPSQKFYCPYKDCSGLLVNDGGRGTIIREAECPYCNRLFCANCKVPWHYEFQSCEEFMSLNKGDGKGREDLLVLSLAKAKEWQRCPNCRFFVERKDGCLHITCRCEHQFCYGCGKTWSSTHICPPNPSEGA